MALIYHRTRWPKVTSTHIPPTTHPPTHTHTLNTHSYVQDLYIHLNKHRFTVIGETVSSSTEHEQDSCLRCSLIYRAVLSSTRERTVTKTFPKFYVDRNGKRNQQETTHSSVWIAQDTTESRVP